MSSHSPPPPPPHCNAMCIFSHRAFQEDRIHRPVKCHTGLECGHLQEADWSTKKAREAILVLSEGFVALKGCGDVLWHLGSCMVLLRALRGHSLHHTLPSKTKTYLSLANTTAALKEIPGWFHASRGLEVTLWHFCCTVKVFFFSFPRMLDTESSSLWVEKFVFMVPLKNGGWIYCEEKVNLLSWTCHFT